MHALDQEMVSILLSVWYKMNLYSWCEGYNSQEVHKMLPCELLFAR